MSTALYVFGIAAAMSGNILLALVLFLFGYSVSGEI